jgi:glyoxylase-like metal-dependent hydrolase (beta-lactamase superfamily II)
MAEIIHGKAVKLSPLIHRITAPNPGPMTGPGTNSYIIGTEELALIDPGPAITSHINAIVDYVAGRLKWILVTHTHRDHSPAAQPIAEATGASLIGNVIPNDGFQDETFTCASAVKQDDCIRSKNFTIRALLTPGHVSNHVCYLVEEDKILITGDHMMQGSTVVIVPPAGNMSDYIESLRRMLKYSIEFVAPGHGTLIEEPHKEIQRLIEHRLGREKKVFSVLEQVGQSGLEELVPIVYDDVDPSLHQWAALSLSAHLIKLQADGKVTENEGAWSASSI